MERATCGGGMLVNRRSGTAMVVALVYGPTIQALREKLWEDIRLLTGDSDTYTRGFKCNAQGRR